MLNLADFNSEAFQDSGVPSQQPAHAPLARCWNPGTTRIGPLLHSHRVFSSKTETLLHAPFSAVFFSVRVPTLKVRIGQVEIHQV